MTSLPAAGTGSSSSTTVDCSTCDGVTWRTTRELDTPTRAIFTQSSYATASGATLRLARRPENVTALFPCWLVVWRIVVSALALINEVNQRRARLVLRWATVSGHLFRYVINQTPKANSAVHPSGVGNRVAYQLRLERQRQVWFIPLADERGVCR